MQIFLWLLYVSSNWFSFYDFILSLTKLLHTWLLSNLTQVTMNTRKKLRLAWDLSPQTSISIFHKRYMSKTHNIQARIDVYFMNPRQQKFSFMSHRLISFVKALYWNLFPECTKMRILGVILQNFTGDMPPDPPRMVVPMALPLKLICDVTRLWRHFAPLRKFSAYATGDSQDTVSMTPFGSHLLCAATGVQTLFIIIRVHHIA